MLTTSARLLRLLSALQAPGAHSGSDLAERLEVSPRTVRSDIATLRDLGYAVESAPGVTGGYSLGAGSDLPPLLLDDEEAVAMAVGLRLAVSGAVEGIEEASVTALAKLIRLLPSRLRHRLDPLTEAIAISRIQPRSVPAATLQAIAECCRSALRLRFVYRDAHGSEQRRDVEPYRLVFRAGRWYLVGWDPSRSDWRTFRVDRMQLRPPHGPRFRPRPAPDDAATVVDVGIETSVWAFRARVRLRAPAAELASRAPAAVALEPETEHSCLAWVGADDAAVLAQYLAQWGVDFDVLDSRELTEQVEILARRFARAAAGSPSA
jgi:predicted DNA-binding transcriptional regulator YafY